MDITSVRKIVSGIRTHLFKRSNSYSVGMLKSHFRGTGLQFKEHQVYGFGDDTRFIDWKLYAKTANPYIKTFTEERNVEIVIVLDTRINMLSGYKGISKLKAAIEICCLFYLLAKESNDFVSTIIVADDVYNMQKKSGEEGITILINKLRKLNILDDLGNINMNREASTKIQDDIVFKKLMDQVRKKRELVVLSDFNDFLSKEKLKRLATQSNTHLIRVIGPIDELTNLPYVFSAKQGLVRQASNNEIEKELEGIKHISLNVKDRYLENFVKEMI
jgi:uncharacterized protein (DUF58 family)